MCACVCVCVYSCYSIIEVNLVNTTKILLTGTPLQGNQLWVLSYPSRQSA